MTPGEVLGGRFELLAVVESGGMGAILRAHNRLTGERVAVKILHPGAGADRFLLEARTLADLAHPAIVRYVAHGLTPEGEPYLAMEWLDGEDLAHRLPRLALTTGEAIALVRGTAEGLAVAHAAGVVHRDVKPANIFLVGGDPGRAKLIDFGIARLQGGGAGMTRTGMTVGTVGYMAPEQVSGAPSIDARADVFALGCVLFECLTGRPAFAGEHAIAVLAKLIRDEVVRVREVRPDVPPALDDLCARMLAKAPADRPADGAAVARELRALSRLDVSVVPSVAAPRRASITEGEQRLLTIMLASLAPASDDGATLSFEHLQSARAEVVAITQRFRCEVVSSIDGSVLISASGGGAGNLASRGAACALSVWARFPEAQIALTMGRSETNGGLPFGPLIDAAAKLLPRERGIRVDATLAGLLDARFILDGDGGGVALRGTHDAGGTVRTLLGKPTPCVGREKELAMLEAVFAECVGESVARVVLVTGPPGAGKSRLQHELLSRIGREGDVTVLVARLEATGAASAFALARQLVQQAAGIRAGVPPKEQFERLEEHLRAVGPRSRAAARSARCSGSSSARPPRARPAPCCALLEAIRASSTTPSGAPSRTGSPPGSPAARSSWCSRISTSPIPASVAYLDGALRRLSERPWMVLALARPEVHEAFPRLWAAHEVQEIPLSQADAPGGRAPRAGGARATTSTPAWWPAIVELSDGNPFYLEELIRSVATDQDDELPATVLAMVQSRLERLEPEARRTLRAASIFGEVFWAGGVAALLSEAWGAALGRDRLAADPARAGAAPAAARGQVPRRDGVRVPPRAGARRRLRDAHGLRPHGRAPRRRRSGWRPTARGTPPSSPTTMSAATSRGGPCPGCSEPRGPPSAATSTSTPSRWRSGPSSSAPPASSSPRS